MKTREIDLFCENFAYNFISSECMFKEFKNLTCGEAQEIKIHLQSQLSLQLQDWLEKQGEKLQCKSIIEAWKVMRSEVYQQASGNRHEPNYSDDKTKMFSLNDIDEIVEKINEND